MIHDEHMTELKRMLVFEEEFSKTYHYFFDHFGENAAFVTSGKHYNSADLKKMMQSIGKKAVNENGIATNVMLLWVREYNFIHGMCFFDGFTMTIFFFKEISMGMAAIAMPRKDGRPEILYTRFTTFEAPNKKISLHSLSAPGKSVH